MSRRALLFQNLLSLFPWSFFKDFSHFLDFAFLNNMKVISYDLCAGRPRRHNSDHIATQGLTLLAMRKQECLFLWAVKQTPSKAC